MTNDEQVERVAKALSAHWNSMHTNESIGKQWMLARVAVAAMRPEPVTVTTVEELEALPTPAVIIDSDERVAKKCTAHEYFTGAPMADKWMEVGSESSIQATEIDLPATVLYPTPTPQDDAHATHLFEECSCTDYACARKICVICEDIVDLHGAKS